MEDPIPIEPEVNQEGYDAIGILLADSRREAIEGRKSSGIETIWDEDEAHYHGVDEYNTDPTWDRKPPGQDEVKTNQINQSTVFANVTRPYCDTAGARIGDMLVPTDDQSFSIGPTPIPESLAISKGEFPAEIDRQIKMSFPNDPEGEERTRAEAIDQEKQILEAAKEKAKNAEKRINDWFVECQYHSHMREVIDDCAKVGSGILKGPVPGKREGLAFKQGQIIRESKVSPGSMRINYRNFFPDPNCGENIHRGSYTWERDDITEKELYELMGGDYFDDQIELALKEGAHQAIGKYSDEHRGLKPRDKKKLFEIWYYYGMLSQEDLERIGIKIDTLFQHVHVVMVNNRVIKVVESHLDTGEFPYDLMIWQKRAGSCWGIGVSRQIRVPQKVMNGALRMLMDNAGLSGKPMWIVLRGLVEPLDGSWDIYAGKGWQAAEDANLDDVRKAFQFVVPPMMLGELKTIIEMALQMADYLTGMPFLIQGQQETKQDPTLGQAVLRQNNASTVLRRLARLYDDRVTEPHVRRYYNYILQYGDESEKGDFQIDARGSSALVEREIQNQFIAQLGQLVTDPRYGKDPKKWMNEAMKGQRLDPKTLDYEDEEWQQLVEQLSQPPQDSRVQVEEMRQQGRQAELQFKAEMDQVERDFEAQKLQAVQNFEAAITEMKLGGESEIAAAKIQSDLKQQIDKLKTDLAMNTQKLNLQRELSGTEALTPPVEPKPIARPGHSWEE